MQPVCAGSSLDSWEGSQHASMCAGLRAHTHTRVHSYAEVLGAGPGPFLRNLLMRV